MTFTEDTLEYWLNQYGTSEDEFFYWLLEDTERFEKFWKMMDELKGDKKVDVNPIDFGVKE